MSRVSRPNCLAILSCRRFCLACLLERSALACFTLLAAALADAATLRTPAKPLVLLATLPAALATLLRPLPTLFLETVVLALPNPLPLLP